MFDSRAPPPPQLGLDNISNYNGHSSFPRTPQHDKNDSDTIHNDDNDRCKGPSDL